MRHKVRQSVTKKRSKQKTLLTFKRNYLKLQIYEIVKDIKFKICMTISFHNKFNTINILLGLRYKFGLFVSFDTRRTVKIDVFFKDDIQ